MQKMKKMTVLCPVIAEKISTKVDFIIKLISDKLINL